VDGGESHRAVRVSVMGVHMMATKIMPANAEQDHFCSVEVEFGATLVMECCDLTCEADGPVIRITDGGTTAVLIRCSIHHGHGVGVHIGVHSKVILEDNTITDNNFEGVSIHSQTSNVTLENNTIKRNGQPNIMSQSY
jgi:parallel beta-helix repeat protein